MSSNNPAQFNFYLNRQGAQGKQGEKGDQGFSPSITEGKNTLSEYTLLITNQTGTFETANLREHKEDRQGTYMRYDRDKGVEYAGAADIATENNAGVVRLSGQSDFDNLGDETVLTPYRIATANPLNLAYVDTIDETNSGHKAMARFETDIQTSESGGVTSTTITSDIYKYTEKWENGVLDNFDKDYYLRQGLVKSTDGSVTITNWQEKGIDLSVNLPPAYTLPIATPTTLGGIKIGEGLKISEDGVVTVAGDSYVLPPATTTTLGGVKPDGTTITVADDGTISSVGGGGGDLALNATSPLSLTTQQNNVIYNSSAQFQDGRLSAGYALNTTPITIPKTTTLTIDMPFNDGAGYEENSFDFKSFCFYLNPEPKGFTATDPVRTVSNNYDQFLVDLHPKDGSGEIRIGFNDSVHAALPANTNYILRYVFKQDNNIITLDTTSGIYDESGTEQVCTVNTSISDATPKSWEQLFTGVYFGIGGGSNKQFVLDDITIKYDEVVLHPLRTGVETQTLNLDYDDSLTVTSDGKLSIAQGAIPEPYTLPVATNQTLGGVKVDGTTIIITEDGTISSNQSSTSGVQADGENTWTGTNLYPEQSNISFAYSDRDDTQTGYTGTLSGLTMKYDDYARRGHIAITDNWTKYESGMIDDSGTREVILASTTDLNFKADTDFGNVTSAGKAAAAGWGMPDYNSGIQISSGHTAEYNCFITSLAGGKTIVAGININGKTISNVGLSSQGAGDGVRITAYASKGDVITGDGTLTIYPLKGVK